MPAVEPILHPIAVEFGKACLLELRQRPFHEQGSFDNLLPFLFPGAEYVRGKAIGKAERYRVDGVLLPPMREAGSHALLNRTMPSQFRHGTQRTASRVT